MRPLYLVRDVRGVAQHAPTEAERNGRAGAVRAGDGPVDPVRAAPQA